MFWMKRKKQWIHAYALMLETKKPRAKGSQSIVWLTISCDPLYMPLSIIIGIDMRKEKRAASSLEYPRKSAEVIVIPDLDVPGIRATA